MNRLVVIVGLIALVLALVAPNVAIAGDMGAVKTGSCVESDPGPSRVASGPHVKKKHKKKHKKHGHRHVSRGRAVGV